jgi:hypothetical protein
MGRPSREPGERVRVGSAFIQQRTVGKIIMIMDEAAAGVIVNIARQSVAP